MFRRIIIGVSVISAILAGASSASAVIIKGTNGNATTIAPVLGNDPGWGNIGVLSSDRGSDLNGSCVYLGNGWVLTAAHIGIGSPDFRGIHYLPDGLSYRIHDLSPTQAPVDLMMFHLSTIPGGLSDMTISSQSLTAGSAITAIGCGMSRAATDTWWNSEWGEATGVEAYRGFEWGDVWTIKRWGTNTTVAYDWNENYGYGKTELLYSRFDQTGLFSEMQAANGDSGGGVFYKNGSQWELAGILLVALTYDGQPAGTSVYGDMTCFADLSKYRSQIMAVVATPEPSSIVLLGMGAVGLLSFAWRRRSRA